MQALKHFMKCSPNEEEQAIELAIETIARANDDQLTHTLVEYLMGEADGMPKVALSTLCLISVFLLFCVLLAYFFI